MDTRELMQTLAQGIDTVLSELAPGAQFTILIWQNKPDGSGSNVNYISNAQRDTVKAAMAEMITRWDTFETSGEMN